MRVIAVVWEAREVEFWPDHEIEPRVCRVSTEFLNPS